MYFMIFPLHNILINKALGLLDDVILPLMPLSSLPQANPDAWPRKGGGWKNGRFAHGSNKTLVHEIAWIHASVFFLCLHRFARSKLSSALDFLSVLVTCFPSWRRYHMVTTTMYVPKHSINNNEQGYTTKNVILESTRYWVNYPWTCICYSQLISIVFCTYVLEQTNGPYVCLNVLFAWIKSSLTSGTKFSGLATVITYIYLRLWLT